MSQLDVITGSDSTPVYRVRKIGPSDLKDALTKGLADFSAKPSHVVFLGLIYPLVGIGLVVVRRPPMSYRPRQAQRHASSRKTPFSALPSRPARLHI